MRGVRKGNAEKILEPRRDEVRGQREVHNEGICTFVDVSGPV
jgi:hypothetical protein